ncbi:MAG: hypothetical protein ACRCS6_08875 [Turicibacter sp.]
MKINNKFVYVKSRSIFEGLISSIPEGLDPIVFIEDTREVWTCGTYFSMNDPDVFITESGGSVNFNIGQKAINISTSGESLSIKKGTGDKIIISSTALTKINTDFPLSWDNITKKLSHSNSGVSEGTYGPTTNIPNASIFSIPYYSVNSSGHIIEAGTKNVEIRDYVEQLRPTTQAVERDVLLSYNESNNESDKAQVRKANGLKFNDATQVLSVEGGIKAKGNVEITDGDLKVVGGVIIGNLQGDISGSAIPKIHLSDKPEYGGASKEMYGHVILQDEFKGIPAQSSNNTNNANADVVAVAASPYLVYNEIEKAKEHANNLPNIGVIAGSTGSIAITESNQHIQIVGSNGITVSAANNVLTVKGVKITGHQENENKVSVINNLNFTKDFQLDDDNNLSLRWEEF